MQSLRYALVAYVKSEAGEFAERLQRELYPQSPHLAAHLTILPPRLLPSSEAAALALVEQICIQSAPFDVTLGGVETFLPTTPTVYLRVAQAAARMSELHSHLNIAALAFHEEWPYVPHLTIAKLDSESAARAAAEIARLRWASYPGSRVIHVDRLTFVREDSPNCWVDLAPVLLGPTLVSR